MGPRLTREGDLLVVDLAGIGKTEFEEGLPRVKAIEGRRYNPDRKVWEFMADPMTAHKLIHQAGAEPSQEVLGWVRQEMAKRAEEVVTKLPKAEVEDLAYERRRDLYEHQVDAVAFLTKHPRSILADDMGLGKTVEAIATVQERRLRDPLRYAPPYVDKPKLIVAPSSLLGNWKNEVEAWAPGAPVFVITGRKPAPKRKAMLQEALQTPGAWIIVNYEQIRAQKVKLTPEEAKKARRKTEWRMKEPLFTTTEWAAVILDEAHRIKNRDAQQTRGAWQLSAPAILLLTGTPVLNSPDELWPLLVMVRPEQYGEHHRYKIGYHAFFSEYVEASEGHYGKIITGVKNADALRFELSDKLVRRTKGQVLDLPPKIRTTIPLELNPKQAKLYREAETAFFLEVEQAYVDASAHYAMNHADTAYLDKMQSIEAAIAAGDVQRLTILVPNAAARLVRLQQILESPALLGGEDDSAKLDAAVEKIADNPGRQFVVVTKFKGTTGLLAERLRRPPHRLEVGTITGDVPPEVRTSLVAQFQAGEIDVLVATIETGGVGLTLTAADTIIFITRHWTPGINEQAEDRLHRIGQNSTVNVLILEGTDTVDDGRIAPKNLMKELTVGAVIQQDPIERNRAA